MRLPVSRISIALQYGIWRTSRTSEPAAGMIAPLDLLQGEARRLGRHAQIGRLHQFEPTRDAKTVDRGDDRLVQAPSADHRDCADLRILLELAVPFVLGLPRAGHQRNRPREIGARGEGFVAGAGDDRGAHVVVVGHPLPGLGHAHDDLRAQRVVDFGTVDGEVSDMIADLEQ
jgi:hypothetical protein